MNLRVASPALLPILTVLLSLGTRSVADERVNETPSSRQVIVITTTVRGLAAAEVEIQITAPLENAIHGLPGIKAIFSTSRTDQSVVSLELSPKQDIHQARQAVAQAIRKIADRLPAEASPPMITDVPCDAWPGIWLTLSDANRTADELFDAAMWTRGQLLRIPNVSDIRIIGGEQRELEIRCDPRKLVAHGLSFERCLQIIQRKTNGKPLSLDALMEIVLVTKQGVATRVRDIADGRLGASEPDSLGWIDGRLTVTIGVFVRSEVADASLEQIRKELPRIKSSLSPQADLSPNATLALVPSATAAHGGLLVELLGPPRAKLEVMRRLTDQLERQVRPLASRGVLSIWERDDDSVIRALFHARPGAADNTALLAALRKHRLPGVRSRVAQLPRGPAAWPPTYDLELSLSGPDHEQLAKWSQETCRQLASIGCLDVVGETTEVVGDLSLKPDKERLKQLGLTRQSLMRSVLATTHGVLLSDHGPDRLAVRVFLANDANGRDLSSLPIPIGGSLVPLSAVADISQVAAIHRRRRRDLHPNVRITAAFPARAAPAAAGESALRLAQTAKQAMKLSDEYIAKLR